jgi:ABC-2 type transport system ATP-binding protein
MDFVKDNWQYCYGSCVTRPGEQLPVAKSEGTIRFSIEQLLLLPGRYYLDFGINGANGEEYDIVRNLFQIIVRDYPNNEFGPCTFEHEWSIE